MDHDPCPSQTAGPYFHLGCTDTRSVRCVAGPKAKGERVRLTCRVLDGNGVPVNDAMIEIWQADSEGKYHHPDDPRSKAGDPDCPGFGRSATDAHGISVFETIKPGRVPGNDGSLQAPHLNVSVFARGILKRLATRIYFAGDSTNQGDPILALVPAERRKTLMATPGPGQGGDWRFDLHLCGEEETVFFDV
jgi:protocatechuate 3,4-dioxygenase, alpha subunit